MRRDAAVAGVMVDGGTAREPLGVVVQAVAAVPLRQQPPGRCCLHTAA